MNQERSRIQNQPLSHGEADKTGQKNVELTNLQQIDGTTKQSSNFHQSTLLHQPLWFWSQHSSWSYFMQGLFWGGIVSLTSVCSGVFGVALTRIDAVEQALSQKIDPYLTANSQVDEPAPLVSPVNVLLLEVKSHADEMIEFSNYSSGEITAILLLKFDPKSNSTQVVNIPQDNMVEIPGYGQGVIQDAYSIGGIKLLSKLVHQLTESRIDRYILATPEVFHQLSASGKITIESCDYRIKDCLNLSEQVVRQQTTLETIRQRLNIPNYFTSFKTALVKAQPNMDTNISVPEILSLANFIKESEPNELKLDLLSDYSPGKARLRHNQTSQSSANQEAEALAEVPDVTDAWYHSRQDRPIAVQNTTDNPELGRQVVAYLRHRNFRDVYLVSHIPLELEQTKILVNKNQLETARHLKNVLGFGNLAPELTLQSPELILQLGEDAVYLPTNYRSYN